MTMAGASGATADANAKFAEPRIASPVRRMRVVRAMGRRTVGVVLLLVATVLVLLGVIVGAVFTVLTAPWRPRLGRIRRVVAIAAVYSATEIVGLTAAAWRWVRRAGA